jgi:C1A family cysteine protease
MRILPLGKPDMRSRKKGKANRGRSRKLSFLLVMILAAIMALLPLTSMQPASGSPEESQTEATEPDLQAEQTASSGEHYTGCIDSPPDDYPSFSTAGLEPATASSVDLSPYLPPVGDQGGQGSCVAFATGYYMKTGQEKMYDHPQWNLDLLQYRFSPSFIFNQIKVFQYIDPDTGRLIYGSTIPAALEILKEQGDVDVEEMPYNEYDVDTQPTVAQKEAAKPYRISEYTNLWDNTVNPPYNNDTQGGINELKTALANNRPVVMWAYIYDDFPDNGGTPSSLFYDHPGSHELDAGRHALCICGYDDNINPSGADAYHRGGFKIVNSWGADWNSPYNGYLYLSYDFVNRFVNEAWTTEDRTPDSPRITSLSDTIGLQPGGTIHIYGENFGTYRRAAKVTLNGNTVNFGGFNDGEVTISLPSGMTSGAVRVYDWEGTPSNPWSFVTEAPLEEDQIYSNWYFAEGRVSRNISAF